MPTPNSLRRASALHRQPPFRPSARRYAGLVCISAVFAAMPVLAPGGCATKSDPSLGGPVFPDDKSQGMTLDIQVVRQETTIRLTNTTPRSFGKSRLWINRWYSRDVDALDVGQTLEFTLTDFRDQYGEPFKGGGFFATQKPQKLSQAQLETADSLIGLVVVSRGDE